MYESVCLLCKEEGKAVKYIGESSRSLPKRSLEHLGDSRGTTKGNSHIRDHLAEVHPGADTQQAFRFTPLRFHRTPMARMLHEALLITRQEGEVPNKKEE